MSAADREEREVGDLRIEIDRAVCVGFGDCVAAAPEAFVLDGQDLATFADPDRVPREQLLAACDVCPVDAIIVWDRGGQQLVPVVVQ